MSQALALTRASFPSTTGSHIALQVRFWVAGNAPGGETRASDKEQNEKHVFHQNGKHWKGTLANSNLRLPGGSGEQVPTSVMGAAPQQ